MMKHPSISTALVTTHSDMNPLGIKWRPMLTLSMIFHVIAALIILFIPDMMPSRSFPKGVIYEVDLVEMPDSAKMGAKKPYTTHQAKTGPVVQEDTATKRIQVRETQEKPLVVSKKTITRDITVKKPDVVPQKPIEKFDTKKEEVLSPVETSHLRDAISRIKEKVAADSPKASTNIAETTGPATPRQGNDITMIIYQGLATTKVKSNWAYPTALYSNNDLEAVVLLKVKRDGTIIKYDLIKSSNNHMFDQSVITAIERTKSMPPFPEGIQKDEEEIEITFNIKEF